MSMVQKSILRSATFILGFLFLFFIPELRADCRVYESTWNAYHSIVMENDLIRVTILRESNGSITEYLLKKPGFSAIAPVENPKFALLKDVTIADTNFGGYKDWSLETGLVKAEKKYVCKVVQNRGLMASVLASYSSHVKIDRLMTIHDGSTLVDLEISVTNITDSLSEYSHWAHILITPSGKVDNCEILSVPVGANQVSSRYNSNLRYDVDTVAEVVNTPNPCASVSFFPKQGWKGVVNKKLKTVYGELIPIEQIGKDGYFDFWKGQENLELGNPTPLLTSETIYSLKEIEPKETIQVNLSLFQVLGLSGLSFASRNICLHIPVKEIEVGKTPLQVEMSSPRIITQHTISFFLVESVSKTATLFAEKSVNLEPTSALTLALNTDRLSVPKGDYGLRFVLKDDDGKEIESGDILGVKVIVR